MHSLPPGSTPTTVHATDSPASALSHVCVARWLTPLARGSFSYQISSFHAFDSHPSSSGPMPFEMDRAPRHRPPAPPSQVLQKTGAKRWEHSYVMPSWRGNETCSLSICRVGKPNLSALPSHVVHCLLGAPKVSSGVLHP